MEKLLMTTQRYAVPGRAVFRWPDVALTYTLMSLALLIALFFLTDVGAATVDEESQVNVLEDMEFSALPGNRMQIKLTMSGPASVPNSFTIDDPARIALDFPRTTSNLPKRAQAIGVGMARSIAAIEAGGRTRVVLNLDSLVPYETRVEGNSVYIVLNGGPAVAKVQSNLSFDTTVTETARARRIANVDFRRGIEGEGQVKITLSDPNTPVNIHEEGGQIIVDFLDTALPPEMERRYDVVDFATPVTTVEAYPDGRNARISIAAHGRYEHLAYQADDKFTVEVKPITEAEIAQKQEQFPFTGERLSFNFQDIEVRAALRLIADFTGLNMVTSDSVTGSLTLRLQNVPWDQALDIILKAKGLDTREMGNVIMVAPAQEIAAREKQELESRQQIQELEILRSELIQVNYAKASEIATLLKAEGSSLLSTRGNVSIDERTNTLLIQDTATKLSEIRKLVATLDIPVRQVLIESRIVIASDDFSKDLGVRTGVTAVDSYDTDHFVGTTGSIFGTDTMASSATTNIVATGQPFPVTTPSQSNRLNVNMPVVGNPGRIALALLGSDYLVDLELSALQAEGRGEVISSPRVITANQREAFIEQGVEIPYSEASSSGATSTAFKKAVLSLRVTPQITPDDRVIMDLQVNKDSVGEVFNFIPSIDTREVSTQVLVDNGETVVLGGIYEQNRSHEMDIVPFFGELPLIGRFFRATRTEDDKDELLIFITPKILKEGLKTAVRAR